MKKKKEILSQNSDKKLKKIALRLGIIGSILVIITFVCNLPQCIKSVTPKSARLYGIVVNEAGQPIADAEITVTEKEGDKVRIGFDKTQSNGEFNFILKEKPKATVWVTVSKDGHIGYQNYYNLMGNARIVFRRKK